MFYYIFIGGSDGKESACHVEDLDSIPGAGRSPRERNDNPFQYSCLENSKDRGAWQTTVHGVTKESYITEWLAFSLSHTCLLDVHNSSLFTTFNEYCKKWEKGSDIICCFPQLSVYFVTDNLHILIQFGPPATPLRVSTSANIWRTMVQRCKMSCPRGYILESGENSI